MDPRWLPWCWAVGGLVFAALFLLVQPWRAEFRAGFDLVLGNFRTWLIPAGLLAADALASWWRNWTLPDWTPVPVGRGTAESLLRAVHGFGLGGGAALVAGVALAVNAGGLRTGLRKGVETVTGRRGTWILIVLFISLGTVIADFSLCRMNLATGWRAGFSVLAAPLAGWTSALVLAGLLVAAEAKFRPLHSKKTPEAPPWLETAAAHSVRLWPWAPAHALVWLAGRWLPDAWRVTGFWLLPLPGLALIFAPLVFLHVKARAEMREGWAAALKTWARKSWQALAWGAVAGLWFFLWGFAGGWLSTGPGSGSWGIRITLASLHGLAHTWLTVAMLGAWMALRLKDLPPPPSPPRRPAARRSSPPS
ncbi:MAG: hypothetical protein V4726_21060 [Verrucomicrobiota bacterium]